MFTLVGRLLGVLLLTAGGLKLYGFGVDPVARMGVFSSSAFQFLVIAFEFFLGLWLVSGQQPIGAWLMAMLTFSLFAGVSGYQGWIGQASCGCLGSRVSVNPWIMFSIDLAAVFAITIFRPNFSPLRQISRSAVIQASLPLVTILAGYLALLGSLGAAANYRYGSIDAAIAALRNERLSVNPGLLDMGEGAAGETREATLELTNRTDHSIRLIGGTADCSCTVLGDLPVTIPPGESQSITITMHLPKSAGRFTRKAQLTIDDQGYRTVDFRLTGRIIKGSE